MRYEKLARLVLRDHPELDERWVQNRIEQDPSMLGLGDVIVKDRERNIPRSGRLDLLLQDAEANRRYEVEIQLGRTDESHIIRTIEYWDVERKRYPQYEHTAVIVAEEMTSRFLNVIGLFNGTIPLVAMQMSAFQLGADVASLTFTTVLNALNRGLSEEDEEVYEATDRTYWEQRGTKATVGLTDELLAILRTLDPHLELKFNKFYIGLVRKGKPNNFVVFRPQKNVLKVDTWIDRSEDIERSLTTAGIDLENYDARDGCYRFRLVPGQVAKTANVLKPVFEAAYRIAVKDAN